MVTTRRTHCPYTVTIDSDSAAPLVPLSITQPWVNDESASQSSPTPSVSLWDSVSTRATDAYTQYVEPITKQQVDKYIVESFSMSAYYTVAPKLGMLDLSTFIGKAELSMGFKVFTKVANPLLAQFVEAFTDVHFNNAKYAYYTFSSLISDEHHEKLSELKNPFVCDPLNEDNLLVDFSKFNVTKYAEEVQEGLESITPYGLMKTGTISATASAIKDFAFDMFGLEPYFQGYIGKNYVSYYLKEGIKDQLRSLIKPFEDYVSEVIEPATTLTPLAANPELPVINNSTVCIAPTPIELPLATPELL